MVVKIHIAIMCIHIHCSMLAEKIFEPSTCFAYWRPVFGSCKYSKQLHLAKHAALPTGDLFSGLVSM